MYASVARISIAYIAVHVEKNTTKSTYENGQDMA